MTVDAQTGFTDFTADGVRTLWTTDFGAIEADDVYVFVDGEQLVYGVDYFVQNLTTSSLQVQFVTAPANGADLRIERRTDLTQLVNFRAFGPYAAQNNELVHDKPTMILQEARSGIRSVRSKNGRNLALLRSPTAVIVTNDRGANANLPLWNGDGQAGMFHGEAVEEVAPPDGESVTEGDGYQWLQFGAPGISSTLEAGLLFWFELEETGAVATRVNATGVSAYDLNTISGTPGTATGLIGNGFDSNGGANRAETVAQPFPSTYLQNDFTTALWIKRNSGSATGGLIESATAHAIQFIATSATQNGARFTRSFVDYDCFDTTSYTTGTWICYIAWYDSVAGTVNCQVNNNSIISTAIPGPVNAGPYDLAVDGGFGVVGVYDNWAFWNRILSASERAAFFNGGLGIPYPG